MYVCMYTDTVLGNVGYDGALNFMCIFFFAGLLSLLLLVALIGISSKMGFVSPTVCCCCCVLLVHLLV